MKVLIAGASGAIGRQVVPQLCEAGHSVTALARSTKRSSTFRDTGVDVVAGDALDREEMRRLVSSVRPDAIVNLLTALPAAINPKRIDRDMAATNRLRLDGSRNLLDAGAYADVKRHVVESVAFMTDPSGPPVTDESAPLWQSPPKRFEASVQAVAAMEELALSRGGTVLRLGHLYGPGTAFGADGAFTQQVCSGKVPIIGGGQSMFSFVSSADAASGVLAALATDRSGIFNIVDDEPAPVTEWLPALARILDSRPPKRVPRWLARLAVGDYGVAYMTSLRGSSNQRAKRDLVWQPSMRSWKQGFAAISEGPTRTATPQD
jgi:nucleoside-diphosphate-sugar epimerase